MRRVQRAKDKEQLVQDLTSSEASCFSEIWRLLMFAATLGFRVQRREPLGQIDSGKAIPENYFANNSQSWPGVVLLMGLVDTEDTEVLGSAEEAENVRLTLFEEYANGGLAFLEEQLNGRTATPEVVWDIIDRVLNPEVTPKPDLDVQV